MTDRIEELSPVPPIPEVIAMDAVRRWTSCSTTIRDCILASAVGAAAGAVGMGLALLLHLIQHLAFGFSPDAIISTESFLQGVADASPTRRFSILILCGAFAGFGWFGLERWGRPLVAVSAATARTASRMPSLETVLHALLQIVTVALGSPLGREVAPRELGALIGQRLAVWVKVDAADAALLVACGSGAGLAAVYNVPVAGTIFVLEVLLKRFDAKLLLMAFVSCVTASLVAGMELGNAPQYAVELGPMGPRLLLFSLMFGPLLGMSGLAFRWWSTKCSARSAKGVRRIYACLAAFALVGALSVNYPQLPGNGRGPAELAFSNDVVSSLALALIMTKLISISFVLRAGARGGLLTPGFALGALLGVVLGRFWSMWLPALPINGVALVGAAAFLSCSMAMPITAVALAMQFTGCPIAYLLPVGIAVAAARAAQSGVCRTWWVRSQLADVPLQPWRPFWQGGKFMRSTKSLLATSDPAN